MSRLLINVWCTCALAFGLAGCGDSANVVNTDSSQPLNDGDNLDLSQPPSVNPAIDDQPVVPGPEGDSNVKVNAVEYPLDAALGDIWGVEGDHYSIDFTITNGKFLVTPTTIDGVTHSLLVPVEASAVIYAELYSPGESFAFDTYSFSPFGSGGGVLAGAAYFDNATVGVDLNESGDVEANEIFQVTGGTIEFGGMLPDIELRFSFTLENGVQAEGHYTGLFDFADRS